jgi:nucleoside-diphosphate-sugar epimerase
MTNPADPGGNAGLAIAVSGADRALGAAVVAALENDPRVIRIVALDESALLDEGLKARLEGIDGLVHAAWLQDEQVSPSAVGRLLEAAGSAGVGHAVFVTSATVYGAWPDNPVPLPDEATLRPNPGFGFAAAQAEIERLIAEWRDDHPGSTVAVLRPTVVVGPKVVTPLSRALGGAAGVRLTASTRPRQHLHLDDLVTAVLVALRHGIDGPCNVAPDGSVPDEVARALAGGAARLRLPDRLANRLQPIADRLAARPVPVGIDPWLQHPWVVASDRLKATGWRAGRSNEEAFVDANPPSPLEIAPRRRQEVALGAMVLSGAAAVAGAVALIRRRRR